MRFPLIISVRTEEIRANILSEHHHYHKGLPTQQFQKGHTKSLTKPILDGIYKRDRIDGKAENTFCYLFIYKTLFYFLKSILRAIAFQPFSLFSTILECKILKKN